MVLDAATSGTMMIVDVNRQQRLFMHWHQQIIMPNMIDKVFKERVARS